MAAIDNAVANLAEDGIIGVADFFTSAKYDLPNRQHSYVQRWFWRSVFDVDGIGAFAHQHSTFASVSFCLSSERLNCDEHCLVFNSIITILLLVLQTWDLRGVCTWNTRWNQVYFLDFVSEEMSFNTILEIEQS